MEYATAVLLLIAVGFAWLRAFQLPDGIDFGWIAIGLVVAALLLVPALRDVADVISTP